ncbi:hypothetical protein FKM82_016728 [Ascaphus truei]
MMQRKVKSPSGACPGRSAELRVFRGPAPTVSETRLPGAPLRRQRSLTNLSVLTDAEKKLRLCGPDWCDDLSAVVPPRSHTPAPTSPAMSRALSRSEHSLLQPRAPSRIPRGPYAEVKPLSKAPEPAPGGPAGEEHVKEPSEDKKAFLKVDPELVVTVLGDLEQLLFSQMLDPETQRKRTVQNVLDLRQNLEETMSSLRGSQLTHSSLDMPCYDSDDANPRSISSLSNRSSPVSWRYGQASPRLQAGEAPSLGGCRSEGVGGSWQFSHTMPLRGGARICSIAQRLEMMEASEREMKSGYGSDSDCQLGKEPANEDDDIITSWDESSSISSGLSDASGNLSSEECNASSSLTSLPSTPTASRRSSTIALRTDSEKRSLAESGLSWHSEPEERAPRRMEYDSGSLKTEHGASRWRRERSDDSPKPEPQKPVTLGQPLRKGKNPPVGITSPITHTPPSGLRDPPRSVSSLPLPRLLSLTQSQHLLSPPTVSPSSAPRIARSSSIPAQESPFELFGSSHLGSSLSLADRPKGTMTRSGSFRDPHDDVHGSVLSLASSASSTYSSQIRKLRRELESSQEKVAVLTTQLSANANLVAAFEQSLVNMTSRLRLLADTAQEKDSELGDLRDTIDFLKSKNSEAQAVIHGALNPPDTAPRELRIRRQNSSDSISSLNSISSHCSAGSIKDSDGKKKKKKSWLRSSFNKAFSMKKGPKSASSYSDIEELATPDSSAPTSPKHQHGVPEPASPSLRSSSSSSVIFETQEGEEPEKREVSELRSELWEKEMKLTDIRLEALNSAHQLEQLRETMHNMQLEVDLLKAENDRLKVVPAPTMPAGSASCPSPRRSLTLSLTQSLGISASADTDLSPMDGVNGSLQREVTLRTVIRMPPQHIIKGDLKQQEFLLGYVKIGVKADWQSLDDAVCQTFQDYVSQVDPGSTLGLGRESVSGYSLGHVKRALDTEAPETPPSRSLRGSSNITVQLKGLKERCVDLLVFESLIPKPMLQHYVSLLLKHRRLLLSGPSGTGKSFLTHRLAEYLVERSGREVSEGIVTVFNMHQQSCKDLQLYMSNLANQIDRDTGPCEVPLVILLDDVSEGGTISELVNGALTCKYHKCPYIIGTTNQPVKTSPNHGLHLSFRMLTFSNNVEPANGFLSRYLRRKLLESEGGIGTGHGDLLRVLDWVPRLWYHLHTFLEQHSTPDFLIGPCFFLSCPIGIEDFRVWFIDLWNNSIIPYLQEGAKDGIKVHGHKTPWEDPVEWVRDTLPWPLAQQDQSKLLHLPQPSVGTHLSVSPPGEDSIKDSPPTSLETDPLMAMLLKLQESANFIESPDRETLCDSDLTSTI